LLRVVEERGVLPNVAAKLSVTLHTADDPPQRAEAVAPFVRHLHDCLGPDRLMFGSNWPVSAAVIGTGIGFPCSGRLIGDDERIWSGTAQCVYGHA